MSKNTHAYDACLQQTTDDALGKGYGKTMPHHIAAVTQGVIKQPDHKNVSFLFVVYKIYKKFYALFITRM